MDLLEDISTATCPRVHLCYFLENKKIQESQVIEMDING
jgi:hypothetical protein